MPLIRLALLACLAALPAGAARAFSASAAPDHAFTAYFNRCGPGLTGGDSAYSTPLPDGSVMWLFSDSFIGRVAADGRRDHASSQFIQGNTLALQSSATGALTSYLGLMADGDAGTQTLPSHPGAPFDSARCPPAGYTVPAGSLAMFRPERCPGGQHCYYWGGGLLAERGRLHAFLQLMVQTGPGPFDFARRHSALATLPLKALATAQPAYQRLPNNGVSYGSAVMQEADEDGEHYTYVYGTRAEYAADGPCRGHCLHVARAPRGELTRTRHWRYWGQTSANPVRHGWTRDASKSTPMAGSDGPASAPMTQDQMGITRMTRCGPALPVCYVIIAHQYTGGFTRQILAWYAAEPQGPWTGPTEVYSTPESTQPGQLFTYNAKIHPEFTGPEGLLVSYDVNGLADFDSPLNPFVNAASYRPRFIRVQLSWEASPTHQPAPPPPAGNARQETR